MTDVRSNLEKIRELESERDVLDGKIRKLRNRVDAEYVRYIEECLREHEDFYAHDLVHDVYYHFGKFECMGWCWQKNAKRKKGYLNDWQFWYDVLEGFNALPQAIYMKGFDNVEQNCYELDTSVKDGIIRAKDIDIIEKNAYERVREKALEDYNNAINGCSTDSDGVELHAGDKVRYAKDRKLHTDEIAFIIKGRAYLKESLCYKKCSLLMKISQ